MELPHDQPLDPDLTPKEVLIPQLRNASKVRIGAWNINHMKNKLPALARYLDRCGVDILAVQETMQHKRAVYKGVITDKYDWIEPDSVHLPEKPGGDGTRGTGFWVNKTIRSQVEKVPCDIKDTCWLRLKTRERGKEHQFLIGSVYLPVCKGVTNVYAHKHRLKRIAKFIKDNRKLGVPFIMGDWNAWLGEGSSDEDVIGEFNATPTNAHGGNLREFLEDNELFTLNGRRATKTPEFTRFQIRRGELMGSVVDYIATTAFHRDRTKIKVWSDAHLDGTDHYLITTDLAISKFQKRRKTRKVRKRICFEKLIRCHDIRHDFRDDLKERGKSWLETFKREAARKGAKPESIAINATRTLTRIYQECARIHCGTKKIVEGRSKDWWDDECTAVHTKLNKMLPFKNKSATWIEYQDARKSWNRLRASKIRQSNRKNMEVYNDWHRGKDNRFWKILKKIKRDGSKIGDVREVKVGSSKSSKPTVILDEFTKHYAKLANPVGSGDADTVNMVAERLKALEADNSKGPTMLSKQISRKEITDTRRNLFNSKASGTDNLNGELLKYGKGVTDNLLFHLFNYCFNHECIDMEQWRTGRIVNLYKSGDSCDPGNYRGITLFSVLGKMYAKILASRISNFLETNDQLSEYQNGFRTRDARNCVEHCYVLEQICRVRKQDGNNTFLF